jgi:hypothetical protein
MLAGDLSRDPLRLNMRSVDPDRSKTDSVSGL